MSLQASVLRDGRRIGVPAERLVPGDLCLIEAGDRVSIWAPNHAEWIVAVLGLLQAGAVLVPVNTRFKGAETADILTRSHAKVLVTVTDFLDTDYLAMLEGAGAELADLETVVIARGDARGDSASWPAFEMYWSSKQ